MNTETKTTEQKTLTPRPPIVAVLGHVDHGKSTLLDYIRKTNVAGEEAGGITQHLGAYEVTVPQMRADKDSISADQRSHQRESTYRSITFLDTPGHEAFKAIRERGARVADIAVLVVSGEEGVKPQTLEALQFIKRTKIPYIIAITKIDKPTADAARTKQSLAEHEIYVEGYGGDIPSVPLSSKTGVGVAELLDMVLLVADLKGVSADPIAPVAGYIIEASVNTRDGVSATALITNGVLAKGICAVAEDAFAPMRRLTDIMGEKVERVSAGCPVRIFGWNRLPRVGAALSAAQNKREAEEKTAEYAEKAKPKKPSAGAAAEPKKALIPLIIKADAAGSLEALEHEIEKQQTEKVRMRILQRGIGDINEGNAKTAAGAAGALILGFNVKTDAAAKQLIERDRLTAETFDVIYRLGEWLAKKVTERTPKEKVEELRGSARIIKIFSTEKDRQIVGGKVLDGELSVGDELKVLRRDAKIGKGKIRELQHQKAKITRAPKDSEFGALVSTSIEIMPNDRIETFVITEQ